MAALQLRKATSEHTALLFDWANEPEIRAQSFHPDAIPWESHTTWLEARLADPNSTIYIGYGDDDAAIGQIRFDLQDNGDAVVDIHIGKAQRGRGYGASLLRQGAGRYFSESACNNISAVVKQSNPASLRIFEKAGFAIQRKCKIHGHDCVELVKHRHD